jgi:uncharacterized surface protein with fasciclin (FAS1) repeats
MSDIVETARSSGNFKTLLQAAQVAGVVDTLKGRGPYTIFAPNDEAFKKLPDETLQSLLQDKAQLTKLINNHVTQGKMKTSELAKSHSIKTLQGQNLSINSDNGVRVNNARVITSDIEADNGVIHVIDTVLQPR